MVQMLGKRQFSCLVSTEQIKKDHQNIIEHLNYMQNAEVLHGM